MNFPGRPRMRWKSSELPVSTVEMTAHPGFVKSEIDEPLGLSVTEAGGPHGRGPLIMALRLCSAWDTLSGMESCIAQTRKRDEID